MDAGIAAIIGAAIGALAAPVSQFLIRRADRSDRATELRNLRTEQQREAITAIADAFNALIEHHKLSQERVDASRGARLSVARFDLLVERGDEELVKSLRSVAQELTLADSTNADRRKAAIEASNRWLEGAADWLRDTTNAHAVLVAAGGG